MPEGLVRVTPNPNPSPAPAPIPNPTPTPTPTLLLTLALILTLTLTLGVPGASTLNFFVDFPAEATRNDVTLPEGRVFFR